MPKFLNNMGKDPQSGLTPHRVLTILAVINKQSPLLGWNSKVEGKALTWCAKQKHPTQEPDESDGEESCLDTSSSCTEVALTSEQKNNSRKSFSSSDSQCVCPVILQSHQSKSSSHPNGLIACPVLLTKQIRPCHLPTRGRLPILLERRFKRCNSQLRHHEPRCCCCPMPFSILRGFWAVWDLWPDLLQIANSRPCSFSLCGNPRQLQLPL